MANTPLQDIFDRYRTDPDIAKKSKTWFNQQIVLMSRKSISPNQILRDQMNRSTQKIIPGRLYMFSYDAKTKETLPYYDQFPLVFPFRKTITGFVGLNLHYLPYALRILLLDRLMSFKTNNNMDETTKLKYSWSMIDGMSKFKLAQPCVKQYLKGHLRSGLIDVSSKNWTTAMMLPVERFVGASKQSVWSESIRGTI